MGGPFSQLSVPASAMSTYRTWIDAISDNIANVNTARPSDQPAFQERYVVARAKEYGQDIGKGVEVAQIRMGDPKGRLVYEPTSPLADVEGYVRYPDINMADQMTHLLVAQRAYQLNISTMERARDSYQRALEIGK